MRLGRNSWRWALPVAVAVAAAAGPGVVVWASVGAAPGQSSYLSGPFTQKTVDRFVHDLSAVGVGVYTPGAGTAVRAVRAPVSPMRLTVDQARAAALGVWSHAGLSGATLDGLAPLVRLTPKLRVP